MAFRRGAAMPEPGRWRRIGDRVLAKAAFRAAMPVPAGFAQNPARSSMQVAGKPSCAAVRSSRARRSLKSQA